jgi:hypothetical protein
LHAGCRDFNELNDAAIFTVEYELVGVSAAVNDFLLFSPFICALTTENGQNENNKFE